MTQKKYAINTDFYKQYGMTMAEMARRSGVTRECIRRRYRRGIPVDGPSRAAEGRSLKTYEGKTRREWARELNVPLGMVSFSGPGLESLLRLQQRQQRSSDAN